MKIERISDHQIRCTLTGQDLAARQLKLSELAYGSENARQLFKDMMQKASYELGFEAEEVPLMIEAVPISADSIILIITKVDDPEELDTRFANFAPSVHEEDDGGIDGLLKSLTKETENVLDIFKRFRPEEADASVDVDLADAPESNDLTRAFSFNNLDEVIKVAKLLERFYFGNSSLYKDEKTDKLILVVSKTNHTPEDFNKVCNIVSEYGESKKFSGAAEAYLTEHGNIIIKDDALRILTEAK